MNTKTLQSTSYSVNLAVNVVRKDDNGLHFTVYALCSLAPILFTLWQLSGWLTSALVGWTALAGDVAQVVNVANKVFTIGLNSLAYGVGV